MSIEETASPQESDRFMRWCATDKGGKIVLGVALLIGAFGYAGYFFR